MSGDGGLGLMVSLQKCGLVPGEPIPVAVELDNHVRSSPLLPLPTLFFSRAEARVWSSSSDSGSSSR